MLLHLGNHSDLLKSFGFCQNPERNICAQITNPPKPTKQHEENLFTET